MSKKKPEAKDMITAEETATRVVKVDLVEEVHRMLRKLAADEDVSMAGFVRTLVEKTVRDEFKRRGLK